MTYFEAMTRHLNKLIMRDIDATNLHTIVKTLNDRFAAWTSESAISGALVFQMTRLYFRAKATANLVIYKEVMELPCMGEINNLIKRYSHK